MLVDVVKCDLIVDDIKCDSYLKLIKHKLQVFQGKIGVAKRRMRLDVLEIYRLKEGNIALISLRRFSFSEHSI